MPSAGAAQSQAGTACEKHLRARATPCGVSRLRHDATQMNHVSAIATRTDTERIEFIRATMPAGGMFQDKESRQSPQAFPLSEALVEKINALGSACHAFQRACNRLYFESAEGGPRAWVAHLLDQGKPPDILASGRHPRWRDDLPRVIRPDLILTETGLSIT